MGLWTLELKTIFIKANQKRLVCAGSCGNCMAKMLMAILLRLMMAGLSASVLSHPVGFVASVLGLGDVVKGVAKSISTMYEHAKENKEKVKAVKDEAVAAADLLERAKECLEQWDETEQERLEKELEPLATACKNAESLVNELKNETEETGIGHKRQKFTDLVNAGLGWRNYAGQNCDRLESAGQGH